MSDGESISVIALMLLKPDTQNASPALYGDAHRVRMGVATPVLDRALTYWRNIDRAIGDRIAEGVNGAA